MKPAISNEHQAAVAHHLRVGGYDPYNSLDTQIVLSWELDQYAAWEAEYPPGVPIISEAEPIIRIPGNTRLMDVWAENHDR